MFYSQNRIDGIIAEDIPYFDLTSHILEIDGFQTGRMEFFTRKECILAGTDAVTKIMATMGLRIERSLPSGTKLQDGKTFMSVVGPAEALHRAWKVSLNCFDHLSAVATKTRSMVDAAHAANPDCEVFTTRKSMPGTKDLMVEAVLAGGALPHRLGLSETVLVFDHHIAFAGGFDAFLKQVPQLKRRCVEKKLFVEANAEQARKLAQAGVDGVQLDKIPLPELQSLVHELRSIDPRITIIAAGGINALNVADYAATGVNGLATTACFTAKPVDMSVRMTKL